MGGAGSNFSVPSLYPAKEMGTSIMAYLIATREDLRVSALWGQWLNPGNSHPWGARLPTTGSARDVGPVL